MALMMSRKKSAGGTPKTYAGTIQCVNRVATLDLSSLNLTQLLGFNFNLTVGGYISGNSFSGSAIFNGTNYTDRTGKGGSYGEQTSFVWTFENDTLTITFTSPNIPTSETWNVALNVCGI